MRLPNWKFKSLEEERDEDARRLHEAAWPDMFANLQSAYAELNNAQLELERRASEVAETRDLFQQVISSMSEALFLTDRSGRVIRANPAAAALLECQETSIQGRPLTAVCGADDIPATPWKLMEMAPTGRISNLEIDLRTSSGATIKVSFSLSLMHDKQNKITGVLAVARDMRDQQSLINDLVAARTRLQELLEFAPDAIVLANQAGQIVLVNSQTEKLFGYKRDDLLNQDVDILVPERLRNSDEDQVVVVHREEPLDLDEDLYESYMPYAETRGDVSEKVEYILVDAVGREFPAEITRRQIETEDGPMMMSVIRDISERKRAEAAVSEATAVQQAILQHAGYLMISTTEDGTILTFNPAAERMLGHTAEEVIGKARLDLFHDQMELEDRAGAFSAEVGSLVQSGFEVLVAKARYNLPNEHEWTFLHRNGRRFKVTLSVTALRDPAGNVTGFLGIASDISERKAAEEEQYALLEREQEARKVAEDANRLKDDFLAMISHELRAPLTAILGWAQMLRSGALDRSSAERALLTIERNARSQAHLVGDLLDASRIATGKLNIESKPVELMSVVEAAVDAVRPSVEAKNLRMQIVLEPWVGPFNGDAERLKQVVWNLLSNAIKFTPPGGLIEVRLERLEGKALLIVSDTGQGIDPEFLPQIFDRFRQADSSSKRRQGGLGLGLAIVKHIVELHGGAIYAYSRGEGQGSDFMVTLPLVARAEIGSDGNLWPERPDGQLETRSTSLRGARVLVVDDDHDTREILSVMLLRYGTEVRTAGSAREAVEIFREWRPDVLVSDIGMPEEDGYALIRRIRRFSADEGGETPAVALTAFAAAQDKEHSLEAGFQKHLAKPVEPVELARVVARILGRSEEGIML
ncbi:MAG: PAS domain S-box protein [Blastocatellia bacterium]